MNNKKNIVLIMYNFPPIGAGRGIAWTYFLNNISKYYNVDVITIEASKNDPIYNESKLQMISKNYNVYRTQVGRLYELMYAKKTVNNSVELKKSIKSKILNFAGNMYKKIIRGCIFPDRMIFWNKYAYKEFEKINNEKEISLIITVGFPFSTHILGKKLKKRFGGKLILDYGDPWSFNPSSETTPKWRSLIDYIVERNVISQADFITVTTRKTAEQFRKTFKLKGNISVIPQGVDTKKYSDKIENKNITIKNSKKITLFYSGIFYEDIRNPKEFFYGLSLLTESSLNGLEIDVIIAGKMEQYVFDLVNGLTFNKNIKISFLGNIPLDDVIDYQVSCDFLLYFGNKGELQVPGKLYEYIAARRPIFAIAPIYDESCEIIDTLNRGIIVGDVALDIKNAFEKIINEVHLKQDRFNLEEIKDYDWNILSSQYKRIIDNILRGE